MPMLNTSVVQHRVAQLGDGRDALVSIAKKARIEYGTLRNAVGGRQPLGLPKCYRLADVLGLQLADILANNDGVPDLPPKQPPKDPKGPPRRQDHDDKKGGTGPRRQNAAVA